MGTISVEVEAKEVGFDADRLGRISAHFRRYVDDGRLPGWLVLVARHGRIAHLDTYGTRDREASAPVELDTLFRIYSMTKPITSVAAMMLYEEGAFQLKDPIAKFIPSFRNARVMVGGSGLAPVTRPASEPIRMWHLLTHTSGLTYGFSHVSPVDEVYRRNGFEWGVPSGLDSAAACDAWASLPLLFEPGTEWAYSVATDVLGRVGPLGITDTSFTAEGRRVDRLAALYSPAPAPGPGGAVVPCVRNDAMGAAVTKAPTFLSGGGGLVSTAHDYHRFLRFLLGGGELEGVRLLGPRTLRYMTQNHLPAGVTINDTARPFLGDSTYDGIGFGLGFAVMVDPLAAKVLSNRGEYFWGGAASTAFWVDPVEDVTALFLTQLLPSTTYPIRPQLRQLVYQALVD
jgi:CubicO group peptidase (beta-lactamase class C family)